MTHCVRKPRFLNLLSLVQRTNHGKSKSPQCALRLQQWRQSVAATAAYIRRLRAELAAAKRDNDEFVAEAVRDTPSQQQQQAPPQQAPPQQVIEQMSHEHF